MSYPRAGVRFALLPGTREWGVRSVNELPIGKTIGVQRKDGMVVTVVPKALIETTKAIKGVFFTYSIEKAATARVESAGSVEPTMDFGRKVEL